MLDLTANIDGTPISTKIWLHLWSILSIFLSTNDLHSFTDHNIGTM